VATVVGMPGVGKAALASRWAVTAQPRFPGAQLCVDFVALPGGAGVGAAVSEVLMSYLRGLGADTIVTVPSYVDAAVAQRC
jgi:hypothetical protein